MTAPDDRPVCLATACTRPQAPGIQLCAPDADRLGQWIARIGDEYAQLSAVPSMQAPAAGGVHGGGLKSHRSVGDLDVMVMRDPRSAARLDGDLDGNRTRGVLQVLGYWADGVREEHRITAPIPRTVATERRLLSDELAWIVRQDAAGRFHDDVRELFDQLQERNGTKPLPAVRPSCPACGARARLVDGTVACRACGTNTSGLDLIRARAVA